MLGGADNSNGELPSYIIGANIFSDERAVGAFFCSALVITLITSLIHRVSLLRHRPENKK